MSSFPTMPLRFPLCWAEFPTQNAMFLTWKGALHSCLPCGVIPLWVGWMLGSLRTPSLQHRACSVTETESGLEQSSWEGRGRPDGARRRVPRTPRLCVSTSVGRDEPPRAGLRLLSHCREGD